MGLSEKFGDSPQSLMVDHRFLRPLAPPAAGFRHGQLPGVDDLDSTDLKFSKLADWHRSVILFSIDLS